MPVLFLQGAQDGLVKPKGTAELYSMLVAKDEDLFVVGTEEHLIFEDENCPSWIDNALAAWLQDKLSAAGKYNPQ
jgi:fermentation-respiration switch protein FrsA (DUF1100 family)